MGNAGLFEVRGDYIFCNYRGPFELSPLHELSRAAKAFCAEQGSNRILLDLRESHGAFDIVGRFELAVRMAEEWRGSSIRLAVIGRPDQELPDHFWETAATTRGVTARVFGGEGEALEWLRG